MGDVHPGASERCLCGYCVEERRLTTARAEGYADALAHVETWLRAKRGSKYWPAYETLADELHYAMGVPAADHTTTAGEEG